MISSETERLLYHSYMVGIYVTKLWLPLASLERMIKELQETSGYAYVLRRRALTDLSEVR
jgi:hypothetical protein